MCSAARRAIALAGVALGAAFAALASPHDARAAEPRALGSGLERAVRGLDGGEYQADEPIWVCADPSYAPALSMPGWVPHDFELRGTDSAGRKIRRREVELPLAYDDDRLSGTAMPRGAEFGRTFDFEDPSGRAPLFDLANGIPAGAWELHAAHGADTTRVLARFRVVEPRGTERSVRDALARASRLAGPTGNGAHAVEAARLYEAILLHYPRTAYLSVVYAGLWRVRAHTRFGPDPDRWLEEIFARFHDTCFGTIALDQWVRDMGEVRARPNVAHLVGLYPDTPLSRAAARYLQAR